MKEKIIKAGTFFRLIDAHDGLLSLTNVALILVIIKLGFAQNASVVDLGTLFVALLGYSAKKYMNLGAEGPKEETDGELETLSLRVDDLNESVADCRDDLSKATSKLDALMLKTAVSR